MYMAMTGTFLQRDPVGPSGEPVIGYSHDAATQIMSARKTRSSRFFGPDSNLYEYVKSGPANYVDPMGLDPFLYWGDGEHLDIAPPGSFVPPPPPPGLTSDEMAFLNMATSLDTFNYALSVIEALRAYRRPSFFTGYQSGQCHAWVQGGILNQLQQIRQRFPGTVINVRYMIPPYIGFNPLNFDHAVISVSLGNGNVAYIDNGLVGGSDNIFFNFPWYIINVDTEAGQAQYQQFLQNQLRALTPPPH